RAQPLRAGVGAASMVAGSWGFPGFYRSRICPIAWGGLPSGTPLRVRGSYDGVSVQTFVATLCMVSSVVTTEGPVLRDLREWAGLFASGAAWGIQTVRRRKP